MELSDHQFGLDPSLDSCCARELQRERKEFALREELRKHDVAEKRLQQKREVQSWTWHAGRSSHMDQTSAGGAHCCDGHHDAGPPKDSSHLHKANENKRSQPDTDSEDDDFDDEEDEEFIRSLAIARLKEAQQQTQELIGEDHRESRLTACAGLGRLTALGDDAECSSATFPHILFPRLVVVFSDFQGRENRREIASFFDSFASKYKGTKFIITDRQSIDLSLPSGLADGRMEYAATQRALLLRSISSYLERRWSTSEPGLVVFVSYKGEIPRQPFEVAEQDLNLCLDLVVEYMEQTRVLMEHLDPADLAWLAEQNRSLAEAVVRTDQPSDDEDDGVDYYDCGLGGCQKTYAHEHVGLK